MLSKIFSKLVCGDRLKRKKKKMIHQNNVYEVEITQDTLSSQLIKSRDANTFRFCGKRKETSDETFQQLEEAIKPLKRVRKIHIDCEMGATYRMTTDKGLEAIARALQRLSSLEHIKLDFNL